MAGSDVAGTAPTEPVGGKIRAEGVRSDLPPSGYQNAIRANWPRLQTVFARGLVRRWRATLPRTKKPANTANSG